MLPDERLQLADHARVAAEHELGIDAELERGQMELFETRDRCLRERRVGEVGQRWSAPQPKGFPQQVGGLLGIVARQRPISVRDQALEAPQVEPAGLDAQRVAGRVRYEQIVAPAQGLAQLGYPYAERRRARGRRALPP